ncbi:MAG: hypothetical protein M3300_02470 [Actinomycetota bacterium]|nr:hypothetical protein [Actinomycetota bacterium]
MHISSALILEALFMAPVKRSRLLVSCLFLTPGLVLGTGGLLSAAAAPSGPGVSPIPVDISSDVAHGLIDRALFQSLQPLFRQPPKKATTMEVANLKTIQPFIQRWQTAIARRDRPAAIQAGQDYEAAWQAVEVYINHRSLPLYADIEVDTQFKIDDGLKQPQPDWQNLLDLAQHLRQGFDAAVAFIAVQPPLSPLFDDLVPLRGVRAQLLISNDALAVGDVTKARTFFGKFKDGYPRVEPLIRLRSTAAAQESKAALDATTAKFADPNASAADLTPLVATLLNRFGYAVNLLNAAARAADLHKTTFSDGDKTALTQLNDVALGLKNNLPKFPADPAGAAAGGATGPGSPFAKVQPALESKVRQVNTAATLRTALAGYATLAGNPASNPAQVAAANKTALEAVALAQQTFVGQFWTDPALQAFLNGLPNT